MVSTVMVRSSTHTLQLQQKLKPLVRNRTILEAIARVPRNKFVDASFLPLAEYSTPIPIGYGQTTSSPWVIARMLEMLFSNLSLPLLILEVGVGCGYQTAILAEMGCRVVGIERLKPLALSAKSRLKSLSYSQIEVYHGDGFLGKIDRAPFDGIIICAECTDIPLTLLSQMSPTGRMVLPLREGQETRLVKLSSEGTVLSRQDRVMFVPMKEGIK